MQAHLITSFSPWLEALLAWKDKEKENGDRKEEEKEEAKGDNEHFLKK